MKAWSCGLEVSSAPRPGFGGLGAWLRIRGLGLRVEGLGPEAWDLGLTFSCSVFFLSLVSTLLLTLSLTLTQTLSVSHTLCLSPSLPFSRSPSSSPCLDSYPSLTLSPNIHAAPSLSPPLLPSSSIHSSHYPSYNPFQPMWQTTTEEINLNLRFDT